MLSTQLSSQTPIEEIGAIDIHAHYGAFRNDRHELVNEFRSGDIQVVIERARKTRTEITVVSPLQALSPRFDNDAVGGNEDAAREIPRYSCLRYWVVIDPRKPQTFEQAEQALGGARGGELGGASCVGIKIHPEEHGYPISEYGRRIFELAERHAALILSHSGEENSLPQDLMCFADEHPAVRLILAHLGCGFDNDPGYQVRAIQGARNGNVYVDTSSAQSLMPNLIEWGVAQIGADRILYGTDTPLYCAGMQRNRIDQADISDEAKRLILRDNAVSLLGLCQQ